MSASEKNEYRKAYSDRLNRYRPIAFFEGSPVYSLYQPPPASLAGERSLEQRLRRRFEGLRAPATATIAVNRACQCDCVHCSAVDYNHSPKADLDTMTLKSAIAETVELGSTQIILLGGEPLLRKDLDAIIASVPTDLAKVILFTNGEFLTPERCARLKEAGLMGAFVSLDSAVASVHDAFRKRPGLFAAASAGVRHLREAGLVAGVSSYLSSSRLAAGVFSQMMELGKELGAHEVTFFDAIPSGRWLMHDEDLLKPVDRQKIVEFVRAYRMQKDYPGIAAQSTLTSECGSAFCFAANTQFYLTAWGEMCPCDFTPLGFGTYPETSIQQLWDKMTTSPPYDKRAKACRMQERAFRESVILPRASQGILAPYSY
jgi:MoaA/NifB/PqqE/SkfB family radical SAM enzyme